MEIDSLDSRERPMRDGAGQRAAGSPLVIIIVVLRVVVLAWVDARLHGELLHFKEAEREID